MTPQEAYKKAYNSGKRIPKLEPTISKDVYFSYHYAKYVIEGIFELGEPAICKDACWSYWYATDVIKDRFIIGEPAISQDAFYSYWYALDIIKGKLPDFMHNQMILNNNEYTKQYIEFIK